MCGIVGYISKNTFDISLMLNEIKHRGPDSVGEEFVEASNGYKIGIGHTRLSIIDITTNSYQPFKLFDKFHIVFNGEIYNYNELKSIYLADVDFLSSGDTEVILQLYIKYGTESFKWLRGMFAFSIYDSTISKCILCRDAIGIKPLYYYFKDNELFFSSEISALKKIDHLDFSICKHSLTEFFLNGFVYEPNTGYNNIFKVFPGSFIEIDLNADFSLKITKFWKPLSSKPLIKNDLEFLVKKEYLNHLIADVPIGLFYSGGIDSSLLLMLGNSDVKPYFINSKIDIQSSQDFQYAKNIAKQLHREFTIIDLPTDKNTPESLLNTIRHVAEKSEELIADYTFYVSELIATQAKNKGLKVMLSGMGGDEIFLGYPRYKLVKFSNFYKAIFKFGKRAIQNKKSFSKKIERFSSFFESKSFVLKYTNLIGYFQERELSDLLNNFEEHSLIEYESKLNSFLKEYMFLSDVNKAQILDLYGFLSHNFMVADKSSMLASIELRVPLATPELFDSSLITNSDLLLSFRRFKIPLLNILKQKLNLSLFKRPKEGFNPDLENLVTTIGIEKIREVLFTENILIFINKDFMGKLLFEHSNGIKNHSYRIYQLLYFKYWLDFNF